MSRESIILHALIVSLVSALLAAIPLTLVHASWEDPFYKEFVIQRMMIAKLRESSGDPAAKALLGSLVQEAKAHGIEVPKWSEDKGKTFFPRTSTPVRERFSSEKYDLYISKASVTYALPPALIKAVIQAESAFVEDAVSHKGAQGLMQLMPATAEEVGVRNAFDARANILGGSRLLRQYLDEFGSLKKTLIAYNAGPEWVRKGKGIPKETRQYIREVIRWYKAYK